MACCCNNTYESCRRCLEPLWAILRCIENLPVVGHLTAAVYGCMGLLSKAERAAIKATMGIILAFISFPAEMLDEIGRYRSKKTYSIKLTSRPKWMQQFSRKSLRYLCLPATHQSGTYFIERKLRPIPLISGWSTCQRLTIQEQLHGGVRFLDVRLMSDVKTKEIWLHHNVVTCIKFKEVLQNISDFLKANPSEIIGLHIDNDGQHLDWATVHSLINEYVGQRLIEEHMSDMCIGDIVDYGKNVIIFGVPNVAYSWNCLDKRWPNKCWPSEVEDDLKRTVADLSKMNPYYMFWYKAECTMGAIAIIRNLGGLPGVCVARWSEEKFEFLEDVAAALNYRVLEVLNNASLLPFNVISTDFIDDDFIDKIIEMNMKEQTGLGVMPRSSAYLNSSMQRTSALSASGLNTSRQSGSLMVPSVRSPSAISEHSMDMSYESESLLAPRSPSPRLEVWESTM